MFITVFNVIVLVHYLLFKMAERDESKKYKKKKQHAKHYYYYTPDDYVSDEEYTPCEYYRPHLSREAGLMLYEKASAAQKRLEGILKDETRQKIQCVKEMGRINGHLIAENQHVSIVYPGFWLRPGFPPIYGDPGKKHIFREINCRRLNWDIVSQPVNDLFKPEIQPNLS